MLDRLLRGAGVAALFLCLIVPLVVTPDLPFPYISGKAALFHWSIDAALVCAGLLVLRGAAPPPWPGAIGWAFLAYAAAMLVADLGSPLPRLAFLSTVERRDGFANLAWMAGYFFACLVLLRGLWERYAAASVCVGFLVAAVGAIQLSPLWPNPVDFRAYGTVGNPSYFGGYAVMNLFWAGWLLKRGWPRLGWAGIAVSLAAVGMSQTRGAALAAILGGLAALWCGRGWLRRNAALAGLAGLFLAIIVAPALPDHWFLGRFRPTVANERWEVWLVAFKAFLFKPLTGWGHEGFAWAWKLFADPASPQARLPYDRAHNFVMDRLVEGGVLGAGAYLALILAAASAARKEAALMGMLAAYLAFNLFIFDVIVTQAPFVALLALLASVGREVAGHAVIVEEHGAVQRVRRRATRRHPGSPGTRVA